MLFTMKKDPKKEEIKRRKRATVALTARKKTKPSPQEILESKTTLLLKRLKYLKLHVKAADSNSIAIANYYTIGFREQYEIISLRVVLSSLFRFNY